MEAFRVVQAYAIIFRKAIFIAMILWKFGKTDSRNTETENGPERENAVNVKCLPIASAAACIYAVITKKCSIVLYLKLQNKQKFNLFFSLAKC
jgi:hypothetical protein